MEKLQICKYKNLDIHKITIDNFNITYNNDLFLIQSPIFTFYQIYNLNNKKYLELNLDESKSSHINLLTFIDAIELKLDKYIKELGLNNSLLKTQIITNIQNKKSLKVKLQENCKIFNKEKLIINQLTSNKISLLLKIEFHKLYYSWTVEQVLQLD